MINKIKQKMISFKKILLIIGIAMTTPAMAQKQFTLEDLNFGGTNYHNMVAKNRYTTWWGSQLVRLDADRCSLVNKTTGKEQPLFTLDQLNRWMKTDESTKVHSLYYVSFPYAGKSLVYVMAKGRRYLVDFKKHKTVWQQDAAAETLADWNAVSRNVAYVKDYNLFVRTADGVEHQISNDASREILYGTSVHRDEFGWSKGTFWSPDGGKLLFTRMDQSMVSDYPRWSSRRSTGSRRRARAASPPLPPTNIPWPVRRCTR